MGPDNESRVAATSLDRITVEPGKMGGRPCIRGMRFTVSHLARLVAAGWTVDQIREEFPFIEPEDVNQALRYEPAPRRA